MAPLLSLIMSTLVATAALHMVPIRRGPTRNCKDVTFPIRVSARQAVFEPTRFDSNVDATKFALDWTNPSRNLTADLLKDYQTLTKDYTITGTFCTPPSGPGASVAFLVHGLGFDRSFWDIPYDAPTYSFIEDAVVDHGLSTFSIDRLGHGHSSHDDPLNAIQAPAGMEALNQVTMKLRKGEIPGVPPFEKVAHVGHSFGSSLIFRLVAQYPSASDGIVLTGWSANATWFPLTVGAANFRPARLNQPFRLGNKTTAAVKAVGGHHLWLDALAAIEGSDTTEISNVLIGINDPAPPQDLPGGYLTWSDFTANEFLFLSPGNFDLNLGLFTEHTKQALTAGEELTVAWGPRVTGFAGPVLLLNGEHDLIFCGGDCLATGGAFPNIPAQAQPAFPNASKFETYIQPRSGHNFPHHYNSTGAFKVINGWLKQNVLG